MNDGGLPGVPGTVARAYDAVARAYAELIPTAGGAGDPEDELDLAMVRRFVDSLPSGAAILDAGCGAGRMISYLDTLAPLAIQGCDISEGMVRQARKAHPRRRFEVAAISSLPYADGSFHSGAGLVFDYPHAGCSTTGGFRRVSADSAPRWTAPVGFPSGVRGPQNHKGLRTRHGTYGLPPRHRENSRSAGGSRFPGL